VININDLPFFKVRCSLEQKSLLLKNGYKGYLKKGMTLTGRFMLIRRSLFQLLYDKTDSWLNPKMSTYEH
jgi:HlyD family secretion protein